VVRAELVARDEMGCRFLFWGDVGRVGMRRAWTGYMGRCGG
jgi:hypothetical protein